MSIGILGMKVGMTQIFDKSGLAVPTTIIKAGPCVITQIIEAGVNDEHSKIQIGFSKKKEKLIKKSEIGHFEKSNSTPYHFIKEYKVNNIEGKFLGQVITVDDFVGFEFVNVSGRSIGKGFTGLQKRHNFARGPMSHGSKNHRLPGSIGAGTTPGRVLPGKKMAGHLGNRVCTIRKVRIVGIYKEDNLIFLKGAVQGKRGTLLSIRPY
uniref:ribosomal protein L3 n=1 Tax=Haramonas pauciplastida TaxID=478668 RepID=UPI0021143670|nr:ribosomal protein L3 [Haramonas pauciplastida]UTE94981.1 ribosomal protein L3 [Haramonas pauciplastida]